MNCSDLLNAETIRDVSTQLESVSNSHENNGRIYLRIHPSSKFVETTQDEAQGSSMQDISLWMRTLSRRILQDYALPRGEIAELRDSYLRFVQQQRGESPASVGPRRTKRLRFADDTTVIAKARFNAFTEECIENARENLDRRLATYGTLAPEAITSSQYAEDGSMSVIIKRIRRTVEYHSYAGQQTQGGTTAELSVSAFVRLKDEENLTSEQVTQAFETELYKLFRPTKEEQPKLDRIVKAFETALDALSDEIETYERFCPNHAVAVLCERFVDEINRAISVTLRELKPLTFRYMMGNVVRGGHGEPPKDVDRSLPSVRQLIMEHNTGLWPVKQKRTLRYQLMDKAQLAKLSTALSHIFNKVNGQIEYDPNFLSMMVNYFKSLEKPPADDQAGPPESAS